MDGILKKEVNMKYYDPNAGLLPYELTILECSTVEVLLKSDIVPEKAVMIDFEKIPDCTRKKGIVELFLIIKYYNVYFILFYFNFFYYFFFSVIFKGYMKTPFKPTTNEDYCGGSGTISNGGRGRINVFIQKYTHMDVEYGVFMTLEGQVNLKGKTFLFYIFLNVLNISI